MGSGRPVSGCGSWDEDEALAARSVRPGSADCCGDGVAGTSCIDYRSAGVGGYGGCARSVMLIGVEVAL